MPGSPGREASNPPRPSELDHAFFSPWPASHPPEPAVFFPLDFPPQIGYNEGMKKSQRCDEHLKLVREAVSKIGQRNSARELGGNHMTTNRFLAGNGDNHVHSFYRHAGLAGYTVFLMKKQGELAFDKPKRSKRHKKVTKKDLPGDNPGAMARATAREIGRAIANRKTRATPRRQETREGKVL